MKTNASTLCLVVATFCSSGIQARSRPADSPLQPSINPLTGLPAAGSTVPGRVDGQKQDPNPQPMPDGSFGLSSHGQTNSAAPSNEFYRLVAMSKSDPRARQSLKEIRDKETGEFAEGRGNFALFQRIYAANDALGEEAASYSLFQRVERKNQTLAGECYFVMEPLLARRSEYRLCLQYIGNPETRFELHRSTFQRFAPTWQRLSDQRKATGRKLEASRETSGNLPKLPYPQIDSGALGLNLSKKRFIRDVCLLIEILIGTDHDEVAEKIRAEAVAVVDDPQLQSAVRHAREHLKHPDATPSAGEPEVAVAPLPLVAEALTDCGPGAKALPFRQVPASTAAVGIDPQTGIPKAQQPGLASDSASQKALDAIFADATKFQNKVNAFQDKAAGWPVVEIGALISSGIYDEALQRFREIHRQPHDPPTLAGIFSMWCGLGRKFPPAKKELIEIRDRALRQFASDQGSPGLFVKVDAINRFLQQEDATVALFQRIHVRKPQLAQSCYPYAQAALMQKHEYALCLQYYGDPRDRFESFHTNLIFMRKVVLQQEEARERSRQKIEAVKKEVRLARQDQERKDQQRRDELQRRVEEQRQEAWTNLLAITPGQGDWPTSAPPVFRPTSLPLKQPPRLERSATRPPGMDMGVVITNNFVGDVHKLVEILAGAGRLADAEKIRAEAVAVLDDPRLISAVTDARSKINEPVESR